MGGFAHHFINLPFPLIFALFKMRHLFFLLIFCSLTTVLGQGNGKGLGSSKLLFTVGRQPVTTDEFVYLYKKNHLHKPEDFNSAKVEEYLELYVNFKLKVAEALAQGLDTSAAFRQEFEQYRNEIKKPFVSEGDDLDKLVKEAYQRSTEQVRASHILIMIKTDASPADTLAAWNKILDIRKRTVNGEDFEKLAKEFSEEPSAKSNGGDLSYFSAMDMVYPFETAAYITKVGDISPIVKTRFGYHIIKVLDHRPASGEVEVSHIMIRTDKGDDAKARNTIFEINDQLKAGRSWEELCKEFSEDPNSKNNGGRLRQFKMGAFTTAAPEFEKTAFSLQNPGDISDPIQTPVGWHLVRLEKKIPMPPFKEVQGTLTRMVSRDERLQMSKALRISKMKNRMRFTENTDVKNKVLALADSSLQKAKFNFRPGQINESLCTIADKKYSTEDFLNYVKANQVQNNLSPKLYMGQLCDKWTERILNMAEEEKLIQEKPEFKSILDEYREGILLFTIMEKEVWNKASNDSIGQQKYYHSNLNRYQAGDRISARIFSTDNQKILDEFKTKITIGDTLTPKDLRKLKSASNLRAYEKGESKVTDKISWTIGTHETEIDGTYYLVDVEQLLPPGTKSFEETRASVISDYQDHLEKEWLVELRKKYPVSINIKGKKTVIQELTSKK